MQLLVVEDDPRLADYMREALGREGYAVEVCASVEEAQAYMALNGEPPRVVVLDRMLGRADGASLIAPLKARYPGIGILILSSLDMASEKARIIDAGADEYLAKPFSLDELTARLRLVIRRSGSESNAESSALRVLGNLCLDLKTLNATVGANRLSLTRKEIQLLSLLMEHPGRVFNRIQILDRVWEIERLTESNVVETTIKNIRRKLEEAGAGPKIESKRNMGYWIEA